MLKSIRFKVQKTLLACFAVIFGVALVGMPQVVCAEGEVASVDGTLYATVQEAINNADGKTVTLIANATESVTIPAGTTVTLDLGEYTLTNTAGQHTVTNYGNLTITGNGTIDNVSHGRGALVNKGTVTLESGTLTRSQEAGTAPADQGGTNGGNSWYVVDNNGGEMIMNGGTVVATGKYSSLIRNLNATFTMNGGTLSNAFITLKNDDNGVATITGGYIESTGDFGNSAIQNWGNVTITGGMVYAPEGARAIYALTYTENGVASTSQTTISDDAYISGDVLLKAYDAVTAGPVMEVEGGYISGDIAVNKSSTLIVNDPETIGGSITTDGTGTFTTDDSDWQETVNEDGTVSYEYQYAIVYYEPLVEIIEKFDALDFANFTEEQLDKLYETLNTLDFSIGVSETEKADEMVATLQALYDELVGTNNPDTADGIIPIVGLGSISVLGLAIATVCFSRRKRFN